MLDATLIVGRRRGRGEGGELRLSDLGRSGLAPHNGGHRHDDERRARRRADRELLAEEGGVRSLTVEAIASRSGVAKTTIYRRWRDKWELALDAVMIEVMISIAVFDDKRPVRGTSIERDARAIEPRRRSGFETAPRESKTLQRRGELA